MQLLVDADLDLGEVVVGELDALHRADRAAADQDLVVGDELARVLEDEFVRVPVAIEEEDVDEREGDEAKRGQRRHTDGPHSLAFSRAYLLAYRFRDHGSSPPPPPPPTRRNGRLIVSEVPSPESGLGRRFNWK